MNQGLKIALICTGFLSVFFALSGRIILWISGKTTVSQTGYAPATQVILLLVASGLLIYFISNYFLKNYPKVKKIIEQDRAMSEKVTEKIKHNRELYLGALENTPFGLALLKGSIIVMINDVLAQMLAIDKDKALQHDILDFIHPHDHNVFSQMNLKHNQNAEGNYTRTVVRSSKDNEKDHFLAIYSNSFSVEKEKYIIHLFLNLSDLHLDPEVRGHGNNGIGDHGSVGILWLNEHGDVETVNDVCSQIMGLTRKEIVQSKWLEKIIEKDRVRFRKKWLASMSSNDEFKAKIRFYAADGKIIRLEIKSAPIHPEKREGHIVMIRNSSDQNHWNSENDYYSEDLGKHVLIRPQKIEQKTKKLEDSQKALTLLLEDVYEVRNELELTNKLLENTNKELEAFTYSVSHDLRAPLRSIDGFSQALLEDYTDQVDERGIDYLNRIRHGTVRMSELIDDMLKLSRVSRQELKKDKVNVRKMVKEIIEELKDSEPNKAVKFSVEDGISCQGDPKLLRILFSNLLNNAWKFTTNSEKAHISVGKDASNSGIIYVKDNGIGFDMKSADDIFKPFQRLKSARDFSGTGIGLAIVQRIVQKHGGQIRVESSPGKGTTFLISLS